MDKLVPTTTRKIEFIYARIMTPLLKAIIYASRVTSLGMSFIPIRLASPGVIKDNEKLLTKGYNVHIENNIKNIISKIWKIVSLKVFLFNTPRSSVYNYWFLK